MSKPFSDLYTHVAELTGLPRSEVKQMIIKAFYWGRLDPKWDKIVSAFREASEREKREEDNAVRVDPL